MQGNTDLLWEDLELVQRKAHQAYEMLQSIVNSVNAGELDQPSRQDSQHMNRLIVLADLLYAELRTWAEDRAPVQAALQQRGNGTQ